MSIKIKIEGFEELLKNIEAAGGSVDSACESAVKGSAQIMQSELVAQMQAANVPSDLTNAMPPFSIEREGNRVSAKVGYRKGVYDPKNPSDGYKVVFLNYGTPNGNRETKVEKQRVLIDGKWVTVSQKSRGKIVAKGFIEQAKNKAKPKIKKQQKAALEKILERLNRK